MIQTHSGLASNHVRLLRFCMSKNGPTTVRFGYSAADAVKSKVPIVRTRTNGEINLASRVAKKPELLPLVEKLRAERWRDGKIADWLDENGHSGRFRLKAWLDADKTKPVRTEYADTAEELRQIADKAFEKRIYRRARLAEFSPTRDSWKKQDRWPAERKKQKKKKR